MIRKLILGAGLALSMAGGASALEPIRLAIMPIGENAPSFVAAEQGFFKKHGLEVTLVELPFATNVVQGLVSNSIEIGSPSSVTLATAINAGLDLVGIAGMSVTNHSGSRSYTLASTQSGITTLEGLIGKKVAISGLNGQIDVSMRYQLVRHGIDPAGITFVELPFPAQPDALKSGAIDATITVDPFVGRIVDSGLGVIVKKTSDEAPEGVSTSFYASTRVWADAHPEELAAFRAALEETAAFIRSNPEAARADVGKYTKLPPQVMAQVPLGTPDPSLTVEHVGYWIEAMKVLGMIEKDFDPARLIYQAQ
jgi:NitT/TauT family transport system substrate-binding protein